MREKTRLTSPRISEQPRASAAIMLSTARVCAVVAKHGLSSEPIRRSRQSPDSIFQACSIEAARSIACKRFRLAHNCVSRVSRTARWTLAGSTWSVPGIATKRTARSRVFRAVISCSRCAYPRSSAPGVNMPSAASAASCPQEVDELTHTRKSCSRRASLRITEPLASCLHSQTALAIEHNPETASAHIVSGAGSCPSCSLTTVDSTSSMHMQPSPGCGAIATNVKKRASTQGGRSVLSSGGRSPSLRHRASPRARAIASIGALLAIKLPSGTSSSGRPPHQDTAHAPSARPRAFRADSRADATATMASETSASVGSVALPSPPISPNISHTWAIVSPSIPACTAPSDKATRLIATPPAAWCATMPTRAGSALHAPSTVSWPVFVVVHAPSYCLTRRSARASACTSRERSATVWASARASRRSPTSRQRSSPLSSSHRPCG
mmetsp:Transcript_8717/g.35548  ORF Transcript_8717/g.35548 Transcript_8717/m.35548 type:complete len:441 (-) Transcript_8717:2322-3644(-)